MRDVMHGHRLVQHADLGPSSTRSSRCRHADHTVHDPADNNNLAVARIGQWILKSGAASFLWKDLEALPSFSSFRFDTEDAPDPEADTRGDRLPGSRLVRFEQTRTSLHRRGLTMTFACIPPAMIGRQFFVAEYFPSHMLPAFTLQATDQTPDPPSESSPWSGLTTSLMAFHNTVKARQS